LGGGERERGWRKFAVAVNSEFVWRAEHNARLQERDAHTLPHVLKPCSCPLKSSVFTQVGSLGTITVRKERGGKKEKRREESKDVPPFNNVTNILISKNNTSSSSFLLI